MTSLDGEEYLDWHCDDGEWGLSVRFLEAGQSVRSIRISSGRAQHFRSTDNQLPLYLSVDEHSIHVTAREVKEKTLELVEVDLTEKFLDEQLFGLSFHGMAQRGHLYEPGSSAVTSSTALIRECWRKKLFAHITSQDFSPLSDDSDAAYIKGLQTIQDKVNDWPETKMALKNGRWRVGSAQKLVNLWQKYLWCTRRLGMPLHFPIDGVILKELPSMSHMRWTQLDDWATYQSIIDAAKTAARSEPLAMWELRKWRSPSRISN